MLGNEHFDWLGQRDASAGRAIPIRGAIATARGFSLVELITVVIVVGIVAAIALPRLLDLEGESLDSAVHTLAGTVTSAAAMNYAAYAVNPTSTAVQHLNIANICTNAMLSPLMAPALTTTTVTTGGNGSANGSGNGNGNGNGNANGLGNGNGQGNAFGLGNGNANGNGNGSGVAHVSAGSATTTTTGATSQLMLDPNGVSYSVSSNPTGNCGVPSAVGTTVACVITATKDSTTRAATAFLVCTG